MTWTPAVCPVLLFVTFAVLAIHARLALGHWPTPMFENWDGTALFRLHRAVFTLLAVFTAYIAGPVWLILILLPEFRLSWKTHLVQAGVFAAGWGLIVIYSAWDPGRFAEWFFD